MHSRNQDTSSTVRKSFVGSKSFLEIFCHQLHYLTTFPSVFCCLMTLSVRKGLAENSKLNLLFFFFCGLIISKEISAGDFNFDINARVQDNIRSFLYKVSEVGNVQVLQLQTDLVPLSSLNLNDSAWPAISNLFLNSKRVYYDDTALFALGLECLFIRSHFFLIALIFQGLKTNFGSVHTTKIILMSTIISLLTYTWREVLQRIVSPRRIVPSIRKDK